METTTKPLATESFSYSWLTDKKPPVPDTTLFGNLIPSFPDENQHNFKFDVPVAIPQASLVHADDIFSRGHLVPTSRPLPFNSSASIPASPVSRTSGFVQDRTNVTKVRKASKRIFEKCVKFACRAIGLSRKSNRVGDLERNLFEVRKWNDDSLDEATSPRPSSALSAVEWSQVMKIGSSSVDLCQGLKRVNSWMNSSHASPNRSPHHSSDACWDAENSIREAILYCKRTIEK